MENRLRNLKRAMKTTTFSGLEFNDEHRKEIHKKLHKEEREEDILSSILQLLSQEKTGFELAKQLRGRGVRKFEDNEGLLYTLLHRLEHKEYVESCWAEESGKLYRITKKGSRLLNKQKKSSAANSNILGTLMEARF
ncbi:PadR family transcriptional regulator [Rossellomorea vietnamensis]|uniref:PadR family transcriptional regulator n=1 Tax=Rossellomorea vietnamensis TaxID=218284 RepID=A0A5D4MFF4_9BACI|nr:PadR family transcriptional regulator [Rossellomorea vietnamensis]TYR99755.1 PadR family transcriptional regulator [Rossellomorea vietnamensis]